MIIIIIMRRGGGILTNARNKTQQQHMWKKKENGRRKKRRAYARPIYGDLPLAYPTYAIIDYIYTHTHTLHSAIQLSLPVCVTLAALGYRHASTGGG